MIPRVNQLDAIYLNNEITRLIKGEVLENLQEISPIFVNKYHPEIDLLIQSAVWLGSVGKQLSTFGQQVLRLSYSSERLTKFRLCLHFLLTIAPEYLNNIAVRKLKSDNWLRSFIIYGNNIALLLTIVNFFRFFKTGCKPLLLDVLLGCDYITLDVGQQRNLGYDFISRELIWGGFMELFGTILPLINTRELKRFWKMYVNKSKPIVSREMKQPKLIFTQRTICTYCKERPTLPHHFGCGHVFCYYCIYGNMLTDLYFSCPMCNVKISNTFPVML